MQTSFLLTKGVIQTAESVALEGYNGLKEGKSVEFLGTSNRILAYAVKVLPRK